MRSRGAVRPGTARRVGVRGAVAPARLPRSRPSGARLTARERPASLGDVSPIRLRGVARRGTARSAARGAAVPARLPLSRAGAEARGAVVPARLPLSRAGAEARGAARWVPPRRAAGGADGREAPAARRGWVARLAGAARGGAARCGARWGARCACPGRDPRCLAWPASAVVPRGMDHAAAKTAMQSARERRFMTIPSLWTIPLGASPPIVACADSWIRDRRQIDKHAACQPAGSPGPSPRSPLRGPVGRPRRPRRRRRGRGQRAGGFPGGRRWAGRAASSEAPRPRERAGGFLPRLPGVPARWQSVRWGARSRGPPALCRPRPTGSPDFPGGPPRPEEPGRAIPAARRDHCTMRGRPPQDAADPGVLLHSPALVRFVLWFGWHPAAP